MARQEFNNGFYEGDIVDGKRHGKGTYTWNDGQKYTGEWRNGDRTGYGKYYWADGAVYEGQYTLNKKMEEANMYILMELFTMEHGLMI